MKKVILLALFVCLVTAFAFAADVFTVQSVSGTVTCAGRPVQEGQILNGDAVLVTNLTGSVVLIDALGQRVTINGNKNGLVTDLFDEAAANRVGSNVTQRNLGGAGNRGNVNTASARASDQAGGNFTDAE